MKKLKSVWLLFTFLAVFNTVKAQNTSLPAINNVVANYLEVKNALAADNYTLAKGKAKQLLNAIDSVSADKLTADQKKTWLSYADKLSFDSRHISEAPTIDHQREHFSALSKNMAEAIKMLKLNAISLYIQYCPMKKASWISESATVKNPYYGKQMLTCGQVTETIAPAAK
jgi:hypothetical protein